MQESYHETNSTELTKGKDRIAAQAKKKHGYITGMRMV